MFGDHLPPRSVAPLPLRCVVVVAGLLCVAVVGVRSAAASSPVLSADSGANAVGATTNPLEIAVGSDGRLWYTNDGAGVFAFSPQSFKTLPCLSSALGC